MSTEATWRSTSPRLRSQIDWLLSLKPSERTATIAKLTNPERLALSDALEDWSLWARPSQLPPEGTDWRIWALVTGRGWGKNRVQAEFAHRMATAHPGMAGFVAGRTLGDVIRYVVRHPESGLLVTAKRRNACELKQGQANELRIEWSNGAWAEIHTSEQPDKARGGHYAWGISDEIASWKRVEGSDGNTTWHNLQLALRAGRHPQMVAGTTPRRGNSIVRWLIEQGQDPSSGVLVTRGYTRENEANLAAGFLTFVERTYGGSHLERQELHGELLPDVEGALVSSEMIAASRVEEPPDLTRIVVGVDPSGGKAEQGIVAVGLGVDGHGYVLEDASCCLRPEGWGRRVVALYDKHAADRIAAERNFGGDMVEHTIRTVDSRVPVSLPTASRGKHVRFEPVAALYEQGRMHHVGTMERLEDEVCCFTAQGYEGEESPNRADALVWAVSELGLTGERRGLSPAQLYGEGGLLAAS